MGVLGTYGSSALKYFNKIINSAYANQNTQDMWIGIHAQAAEYGFSSPQTQPPDVSVIRGFANRIVNGARAFAAANPDDAITANMMATAPYTARTQQDIAVNPIYHVRYQNEVQAADGTISTRWSVSVFAATDFPDTVGALQDAIDTHAAEMTAQAAQMTGGESGGTSLSTSNLEISLV